ncbi:MAG: RNA methyltransferase [Firmicutes bacterium]|nr:RNA methyltransferase [Bacillota bacterium]
MLSTKVLKSLLTKKGRREYGLFLMEGEKVVLENAGEAVQIIRQDESPKLFKELSSLENSTGVIGVFKIPSGESAAISSRILVLDRIQDPGNMGTILRTAVAFGWTTVILLDCVDVYSPKVVRAVSGQLFKLDIIDMSFEEIQRLGLNLVVADIKGEEVKRIDGDVALVLGNEGAGVRQEILDMARKRISIPMEEDVESLNVAIAGGILMCYLR